MNNDFKNAVAFATVELQGFYNRGGSFTALNQKGRSELLEVFSDDYDWQPNLINAAKDFHSFDGLKRYCAHLVRTEKQIPDQLKYWISDLLEKVAVNFQLERTRNDASDQLSACDAVHQAIIKIPEANDIRSRQYYTIKRAYLAAKKRGIFVGH